MISGGTKPQQYFKFEHISSFIALISFQIFIVNVINKRFNGVMSKMEKWKIEKITLILSNKFDERTVCCVDVS